jgi:hypothetical protein
MKTHTDTIIDGKHVCIDTMVKNDTIYIETIKYDKEYEIIEKLIDHKDFGKGVTGILVLVFVAFTLYKKWNCTKKN